MSYLDCRCLYNFIFLRMRLKKWNLNKNLFLLIYHNSTLLCVFAIFLHITMCILQIFGIFNFPKMHKYPQSSRIIELLRFIYTIRIPDIYTNPSNLSRIYSRLVFFLYSTCLICLKSVLNVCAHKMKISSIKNKIF